MRGRYAVKRRTFTCIVLCGDLMSGSAGVAFVADVTSFIYQSDAIQRLDALGWHDRVLVASTTLIIATMTTTLFTLDIDGRHILITVVRGHFFKIKLAFAKWVVVLEHCEKRVSNSSSDGKKVNVRSPSSSSIGPLVSGYRT